MFTEGRLNNIVDGADTILQMHKGFLKTESASYSRGHFPLLRGPYLSNLWVMSVAAENDYPLDFENQSYKMRLHDHPHTANGEWDSLT